MAVLSVRGPETGVLAVIAVVMVAAGEAMTAVPAVTGAVMIEVAVVIAGVMTGVREATAAPLGTVVQRTGGRVTGVIEPFLRNTQTP